MKAILLILQALALPATAGADQNLKNECYELQQAAADARARAWARDLEIMEQTILQPTPGVADLSCIDSFSAGIDVTKYDPAAVMSMLERQAKQKA